MYGCKYIGKSKKYKGVYIFQKNRFVYYYVGGIKNQKTFATEREAALFYDCERIANNKQPVNILKQKK